MSANGLLAELGSVVVCVIPAEFKCLVCIIIQDAVILWYLWYMHGIPAVHVSKICVYSHVY